MNGPAVSTVLFDGYSIETAIEEIAASGARAVEPAFITGYVAFGEGDFEEAASARLARRIHAAGLRAPSVSAHIDLSSTGASEKLRRRLRFAAELGSTFLITNAGPALRQEAIRATIDAALADCEKLGVSLALENPGHGSGDLIGCAQEGAAFVRSIDCPFVRLNYDAGNVYTYSNGRKRPEHDVINAAGEIAHLHVKDVRAVESNWEFCAVGEGDIDYKACLAQLPRDIPFALELPLRLQRPGRGDPVRAQTPLDLPLLRAALRRSLDFVNQLTPASKDQAAIRR